MSNSDEVERDSWPIFLNDVKAPSAPSSNRGSTREHSRSASPTTADDEDDADTNVAGYLEVGQHFGGRQARNSLELSSNAKLLPRIVSFKLSAANDAHCGSTVPENIRGLSLNRHSSDSDLSDLGVPDPEPPLLPIPAIQGSLSPHLPNGLRRLQQKLDAELVSLIVPPPPPCTQTPAPDRKNLLEHHDLLDVGEV